MRLLTTAVVLLLAIPVSAQTVAQTLDLSNLGWGHVSVEPIDADGDRTTEEWLVTDANTKARRVVIQRQGRYCVGDWFSPKAVRAFSFVSVTVSHATGRTVLIVSDHWGWHGEMIVRVIKLDIPPCH